MPTASTPHPQRSQRTYAGASADDRTRVRHQQLLDAALDVIGKQGLKAATVRTICQTSGLTQRYYYEAFASADDMLIQVYQAQLDRLEQALLASIQPAPSALAQVRLSIAALLTTVEADPRLARLVFFEVLGVSPEVDEAYRQGTERFERFALALIEPYLNSIDVSGLNLGLLATAIVGALIQIVRNWVLAGFDQSAETIVEQIEAMLTVVSAAGLASPAAGTTSD